MSKTKHYDEREEYAKTPWGNLGARNPSRVKANTSGDRPALEAWQGDELAKPHPCDEANAPQWPTLEEQQAYNEKALSKGESAHTPTADEISGGVIAGATGCKGIVEVADSAMWDKAFGAETVARFMAKSVEVRAAIQHAQEGK